MSSNERYNYFCMFTPEGKVLPIESVMRSTEHGGVCIGLRNNTTGVLIAQRTEKEERLSQARCKIKTIDSHLVYTYSGITNDGIKFGEKLKRKLQEEKRRTGTILPISSLIEDEQFNSSIEVMCYGNRATGVSVIILGVEKNKINLVEMGPTGETYACIGSCIGSRAQSARTVLDARGEEILDMSEEQLVELGISAFSNAVNDQNVITSGYYDICVVSVENGVRYIEKEKRVETNSIEEENDRVM